MPQKKHRTPQPKVLQTWVGVFAEIVQQHTGMSLPELAGKANRSKSQLYTLLRGEGTVSQARDMRDALRALAPAVFIPPIELNTGERLVEAKYVEWVDRAVRLHRLQSDELERRLRAIDALASRMKADSLKFTRWIEHLGPDPDPEHPEHPEQVSEHSAVPVSDPDPESTEHVPRPDARDDPVTHED